MGRWRAGGGRRREERKREGSRDSGDGGYSGCGDADVEGLYLYAYPCIITCV
jgi:hypothetical protein